MNHFSVLVPKYLEFDVPRVFEEFFCVHVRSAEGLLRFAEIEEGDIKLTPAGQRFAEADVDVRKKLFGDHLLTYLPLAARIKLVLDERPAHTARAVRFLEELEDYMSEDYAERTLKSVVNWGRYGELFAYDETSETFSLENPQ